MSRPLVLVVDDDQLVLQMLEIVLGLSCEGIDILTTVNPLEAWKLVREQPVSLLISDFMMPEINGLCLIQKMRAAQINLPVIMLTGYYNDPHLAENLKSLPPIELIYKPWNNDHLVQRVHAFLGESLV